MTVFVHRLSVSTNQAVYQELAKIHELRREHLPLRRGRQFLRPISGNGVDFGLPRRIGADGMRSIVAWSRILADDELLCAINTDPDRPTTALVTVDNDLRATGTQMVCLYSTSANEIGQKVSVQARNGKAVALTVPPGGFAVYR